MIDLIEITVTNDDSEVVQTFKPGSYYITMKIFPLCSLVH